MRLLLAVALSVVLATAARSAKAEQWVLSPGPFFFGHDYARIGRRAGSTPALPPSESVGAEQPSSVRMGGGAEVSLMRFPGHGPAWKNPYGYGLVGQVAVLEVDRHAAWYGAFGVQAGSILGLEAGGYARSAAGAVRAEAGLRFAPYVSFAWAWASFPVEIPLGEGPAHLSALCGFKFPFAIDGSSLYPSPPSERPTALPLPSAVSR